MAKPALAVVGSPRAGAARKAFSPSEALALARGFSDGPYRDEAEVGTEKVDFAVHCQGVVTVAPDCVATVPYDPWRLVALLLPHVKGDVAKQILAAAKLDDADIKATKVRVIATARKAAPKTREQKGAVKATVVFERA